MDGFDEDEIARAIALSLQESGTPGPSQNVANQARAPPSFPPASVQRSAEEIIDLADEDDDDPQYKEELRRAIAESQAAASRETQSRGVTTTASGSSAVATSSTNSFLKSRAEMERERLERQSRTRSDTVKATKIEEDEDEDFEIDDGDTRDTKRQRVSSPSKPSRTANTYCSSARNTYPNVQSSSASDSFFYDGELRQTANKHVDPTKDTRPLFRLTDILSPRSEIAFAIISAYVINFPWMYTFFEPKTPVIVVTQDSRGEETIKEVLPEWIKTTPFLRAGHGCMHMKFMLIFYKTGRLRVVISTANLIEYDWRDIENSVWVQDIGRRSDSLQNDPKADDFAATMTRVLRSVSVAPALITLMRNGHNLPLRRLEELRANWDFSRVKVKLIPSIAGKHEGWSQVIQNGHTSLMKAIRDLGARVPSGKELILECQGSSIGTYSTQWMNEFYCSAQGESAETWLGKSRTQRGKLPYPAIKILFPTTRTVRDSVLGEPGGGTMFCRRNQWEAPKFPRDLFHDAKSKRGRVMMHSKMIIGTFRDSPLSTVVSRSKQKSASSGDDIVEVKPAESKYLGWAYVGSHNFTPSAWGTLSGSDFNPTLNITNYELGIAFPLSGEDDIAGVACWERPPRKYVLGRDEPWFQSESPCFVEQN